MRPLAEHIRTQPYLRERLEPQPGDRTYLHLSDVRLGMEAVKTADRIVLLDFGCGGSPYRALFPNADYRRADFLQAAGDALDYRVGETSRIEEADETFDTVLSTQVLEHVKDPTSYLGECFRLLKKGGRLYLTTHGSYPDHGCPYDFRRWTADGLRLLLESHGFKIRRIEKMTTGPRALCHQLDIQLHDLRARRSTLFGMLLSAFRVACDSLRPWIHRMCDEHFTTSRVVRDGLENHPNYIVVACLAEKPE